MARRFKIEGQYSMKVVKKKSLLAFFSFVDTETGLEYFDWRLMKGTNGVFIGPPSRSYEKDGETRYSDYIRITDKNKNEDGKEWFAEVTAAALKKFKALDDSDEDEDEEEERPARRATAGAGASRSSARGAAKNPPIGEDDDDEVPF
jgi:DNA-binding cell septation regulator SpoVG